MGYEIEMFFHEMMGKLPVYVFILLSICNLQECNVSGSQSPKFPVLLSVISQV